MQTVIYLICFLFWSFLLPLLSWIRFVFLSLCFFSGLYRYTYCTYSSLFTLLMWQASFSRDVFLPVWAHSSPWKKRRPSGQQEKDSRITEKLLIHSDWCAFSYGHFFFSFSLLLCSVSPVFISLLVSRPSSIILSLRLLSNALLQLGGFLLVLDWRSITNTLSFSCLLFSC